MTAPLVAGFVVVLGRNRVLLRLSVENCRISYKLNEKRDLRASSYCDWAGRWFLLSSLLSSLFSLFAFPSAFSLAPSYRSGNKLPWLPAEANSRLSSFCSRKLNTKQWISKSRLWTLKRPNFGKQIHPSSNKGRYPQLFVLWLCSSHYLESFKLQASRWSNNFFCCCWTQKPTESTFSWPFKRRFVFEDVYLWKTARSWFSTRQFTVLLFLSSLASNLQQVRR